MCNKPLVSVITPAYNTGKYINRLLDSVLSQSYPAIEMIVVDDGSTDNTAEIIKSYIPQFRNNGYNLSYYYQDNSGQSVAINRALKLIKGKYLVWPDSDDYYSSPNAIERMVYEFENGDENLGIVRTQERVIKDKEGRTETLSISGVNSKPYYSVGELFEDCLFARNFYYCPGAYMLNVGKLHKCNGLDIYTDKNAGQNWQLMLPMLYFYSCKTIMEPLYSVVERVNSHSRGQYKGYDVETAKFKSYENTILSTLDRIDMSEEKKDHYKQAIILKYQLQSYNLAFRYSQKVHGLRIFNELPLEEQKKIPTKLKKLFLQFGLADITMFCYRTIHRLFR